MIDVLRTLLRRIAAVAALAFGVLLAALVATLTLAAALAIGAALWLGNRFGMRVGRGPARGPEPRGDRVIDVEMREIDPDRPGAEPPPGSAEDQPRQPGR